MKLKLSMINNLRFRVLKSRFIISFDPEISKKY